MSEQLQTPAITVTEPVSQTPAISTAQPVVTSPQAVNVDIDSIIAQAEIKASEAAEKKMEAVFKSMLQQQGFDPEAINKMTTEWKSKQITPEQLLRNKDGEIEQRDSTIAQLQQQIENEQQKTIALAKGVPLGAEDDVTREKANACLTLAKTYMSDSVTFESAIDKAIKIIFPKEEKTDAPPKPEFQPKTSISPIVTAMTKEEFNKLSYAQKLEFKAKNPEEFKKIFQ